MVVWSSILKKIPHSVIRNVIYQAAECNSTKGIVVQQVRRSGGHGPKTMVIKGSDWQWDKFKDLVHFYLLVGIIPAVGIVTYTNIFIGPATLAPIPEGYEPKHWEYHRHPITRFLSHYIVRNPQQEYEKMCHELYEESEKMRLREVEKMVKSKMSERQDYQAWYYRPATVKYARHAKKYFEDHPLISGS